MEFIFILLSWMILLVPGFDDSVPPTGDKIFKIETSPDIVQSITTRPYESFDFWEFDIKLKQNSTGNLDLKIPKNFPTPASNVGFWAYDPKAIVLDNGVDVDYEIIEDPCYTHYSIPIEGKTNLEIAYTVIATGSWQLYTPIQFEKDNPCYNEVFYKKLDSPQKQIQSGIIADQIKCNAGLILIQKIDYSPACVNLDSITKLIERKWIGSIDSDSVDVRDVGYILLYALSRYAESDQIIAIDFEGPQNYVEQILESYEISIMSSENTVDGSFSSNYGNITKTNLEKFFDENSRSTISKQGFTIYPLGGFTDNTGTYGPFNKFLNDEEVQQIGKLFGGIKNEN